MTGTAILFQRPEYHGRNLKFPLPGVAFAAQDGSMFAVKRKFGPTMIESDCPPAILGMAGLAPIRRYKFVHLPAMGIIVAGLAFHRTKYELKLRSACR